MPQAQQEALVPEREGDGGWEEWKKVESSVEDSVRDNGHQCTGRKRSMCTLSMVYIPVSCYSDGFSVQENRPTGKSSYPVHV